MEHSYSYQMEIAKMRTGIILRATLDPEIIVLFISDTSILITNRKGHLVLEDFYLLSTLNDSFNFEALT